MQTGKTVLDHARQHRQTELLTRLVATDIIFEAAKKGDIKVHSLSGNKECPYVYYTLVWQNAFSPDYDLLLYVSKLIQVLTQSGVSNILG